MASVQYFPGDSNKMSAIRVGCFALSIFFFFLHGGSYAISSKEQTILQIRRLKVQEGNKLGKEVIGKIVSR